MDWTLCNEIETLLPDGWPRCAGGNWLDVVERFFLVDLVGLQHLRLIQMLATQNRRARLLQHKLKMMSDDFRSPRSPFAISRLPEPSVPAG